MKKYLGKSIVVAMLLIGPSLASQNTAKADQITSVAQLAEAIVDLFCPEEPQKRCKSGECLDGACISFRKACLTNDDCVKKK